MEEQNIQATETEQENFDQIVQNEQDVQLTEKIEDIEESENTEKTQQEINLGKFKDVSSLLTAYNNLQAEFTKKCQKLSEISKKSCDNSVQSLPQQNSQWAEKVNTFLSANQDAREYSKEISELLISNTELLNSENALDKAWTKVLMNNLSKLKQQMQNPEFLTQLVSNNAEIKDNIIKNYVECVKEKHSPKLMNSKSGAFALSKQNTVSTLEDASKLVRAMFK